MKKLNMRKTILLTLVCLWGGFIYAQDKQPDSLSVSSKLDSIYVLQKKMYTDVKNQPLADKKFGVEFNLFRLLMMEESVSLSGGFSLFGINRQTEIAFPVFYSNPDEKEDLNEFTIDCHVRYFLGNSQNGFYISGFTRYAHLEGYLGDSGLHLFEDETVGKRSTENKIGVGVGVGFRKFSYKGLYWGMSLNFGKYIYGENNKFYGSFLSLDDDEKTIVDFEFLKFGYAF